MRRHSLFFTIVVLKLPGLYWKKTWRNLRDMYVKKDGKLDQRRAARRQKGRRSGSS